MKKIQFKKFKFKKPDISGSIQKLKNLKIKLKNFMISIKVSQEKKDIWMQMLCLQNV